MAASVLLAACLLLAPGAWGAVRGDPQRAGLDPAGLARLTAALEGDVSAGAIAGAALAIHRRGALGYAAAVGTVGPGRRDPVGAGTRFRIYSMTKPIVSVAALQLVEAGRIVLDDPLAKFLPQFAEIEVEERAGARVPARAPITVRDLLRHTSGLTYGFFGQGPVRAAIRAARIRDPEQSADEYIAKLVRAGLEHQPGSVWEYGHSTDVLGRVLEVVHGKGLGEILRAGIFEPLGMHATGFYLEAAVPDAAIAAPDDAARRAMRRRPRFASGGGGLISTLEDYTRFARMLLEGGAPDGRRVLSPRLVTAMTRDHLVGDGTVPGVRWHDSKFYLPGPGYGFGLGVAVRTASSAPVAGNVGDYWWAGYGGTYFWVDPSEEMAVVFMVDAPSMRRHYSSALRRLVYAALAR